jgi:hypothetical protein
MSSESMYAAISAVVSFLIAWIGFKKSSQEADARFQTNLLARIETLEDDNQALRQKNEDLLRINLEERQRQLELERKISVMEDEKLRMLDRIQDLERVVEGLRAKLTQMEA